MRDRGWSRLCVCVCVFAQACSPACDDLYRLEWFNCISGTAFYSACTQSNTLNIYHCGAEWCCEFGVLVTIVSKQLPNKVQMWFQNGTEAQDTHTRTCTHAYTQNTLWVIYVMPGIDYYQMRGESNSWQINHMDHFNLPTYRFVILHPPFLAQKPMIC